MKKLLRQIVLGMLTMLARVRLRRLRLFVVGVTGSVGKTTTKEAIFHVLKTRYQVFRSEKSYNTDFGLPLTILEQKSGFSSAGAWVKTMLGALWNGFIGGRHLQMMIAEMGVDKPGDMNQLLKVVRPQAAVMTCIAPVHLAQGQFQDLPDIFMEKRKLIDSLPEKGVAILNADDPYILGLRDHLQCRQIWYGTGEIADLRAMSIEHSWEGVSFTAHYGKDMAQVQVPILGSFQVYTVLPALAVALSQGFSLQEAAEALRDYRLPPGRMNPIEGMNETLIIDSSYNASPDAVKQALDLLQESAGRRIAVLGSMNELGDLSENKHAEVGRLVVGRADVLLTVGEAARLIFESALREGFPQDRAFHFGNAEEAAEFLQGVLEKNDTILVKGSQNRVRLERLVKKIMQHPERADELLARQGKEWDEIE